MTERILMLVCATAGHRWASWVEDGVHTRCTRCHVASPVQTYWF